MEFKGTKGEWGVETVYPDTSKSLDVLEHCIGVKCEKRAISICGALTSSEAHANANAISAVPEMIAALQIAIRAYQDLGIEPEVNCHKQAINALNKALK